MSCPPPPPPPPYYSLYIKSPPPQELAGPSFLAERGEQTCFWMIKVDCISAGLRFAPPRGTAHAQSDIAFACLLHCSIERHCAKMSALLTDMT